MSANKNEEGVISARLIAGADRLRRLRRGGYSLLAWISVIRGERGEELAREWREWARMKKGVYPLLIKGDTASPPAAGRFAWIGVIRGLALLGVGMATAGFLA